MNKKYELTTNQVDRRPQVYRIKGPEESFDTIIGRKGQPRVILVALGRIEKNLSQDGNCWLFDDAAGYENIDA